MNGEIIDLSAASPPAQLTAEICVIGSGCGGATAAWDLAQAGHEVVVLEEGGDFTDEKLTQRDSQMYDQLYMDRGGRATEDLSIAVLQGRVLGGGGVINACDVVPPPDGVLEHWAKKYGLADFAPNKVKPYVDRALADLSAKPIEEFQVNPGNMKLKIGAEALGYRGEIMMHNRENCGALGTCFLGCPINAKKNPRFVAIPAAMELGVKFYTRTRAIRISDPNAELKRITVRTLDEKGYHEKGEFEIQAKIVIIAANAIATPQLLIRSGIGNEHIGRHLTLQPQLPATGLFPDPVDAYIGIPQSYAVTQFEEVDPDRYGLWGYRIEGIMGTPGIVASMSPYTGAEAKENMARYRYVASALLLAPDEPSGQVTVTDAGRPIVHYTQSESHKERIRHAVKETAKIYFAAGAKTVDVTVTPALRLTSEADLAKVDSLAFEPASAGLISAHQQGTVRFANSSGDGGSNPDGQVYGTRDIYVFDSSGFPTSSSSHTMTPIIAFSHLLSAKLIAKLA